MRMTEENSAEFSKRSARFLLECMAKSIAQVNSRKSRLHESSERNPRGLSDTFNTGKAGLPPQSGKFHHSGTVKILEQFPLTIDVYTAPKTNPLVSGDLFPVVDMHSVALQCLELFLFDVGISGRTPKDPAEFIPVFPKTQLWKNVPSSKHQQPRPQFRHTMTPLTMNLIQKARSLVRQISC